MMATSEAPVDLAELRRAAAPVVAWYEQFLAGRPMALAQLDRALVSLRTVGPLGGWLGRAVETVARAARDATTVETVAALELLRHITGCVACRRPRLIRRPTPTPRPRARTTGAPGARRACPASARRELPATRTPQA